MTKIEKKIDISANNERLRIYFNPEEKCHVVSYDSGNGHDTKAIIGLLEVETDDVKLTIDATEQLDLLVEDEDKIAFIDLIREARRALLTPQA